MHDPVGRNNIFAQASLVETYIKKLKGFRSTLLWLWAPLIYFMLLFLSIYISRSFENIPQNASLFGLAVLFPLAFSMGVYLIGQRVEKYFFLVKNPHELYQLVYFFKLLPQKLLVRIYERNKAKLSKGNISEEEGIPPSKLVFRGKKAPNPSIPHIILIANILGSILYAYALVQGMDFYAMFVLGIAVIAGWGIWKMVKDSWSKMTREREIAFLEVNELGLPLGGRTYSYEDLEEVGVKIERSMDAIMLPSIDLILRSKTHGYKRLNLRYFEGNADPAHLNYTIAYWRKRVYPKISTIFSMTETKNGSSNP